MQIRVVHCTLKCKNEKIQVLLIASYMRLRDGSSILFFTFPKIN